MIAEVEHTRKTGRSMALLRPETILALGSPQIGNTPRRGRAMNFASSHQAEQRPRGLRCRARRSLVAPVIEPVACRVFAPAAIGILDRREPVHGTSYHVRLGIYASRGERTQGRPSAIDVINAPPTEPTALRPLLAAEKLDRPHHHRTGLRSLTELGQHGEASSGKIGSWRIEQRTMIGERDVVQIVAGVVSVERSPSAVAALHTDDPLSSTHDGIMELRPSGFGKLGCPIHRHDHNCGIIQIYVIWIDVLERTAAQPPGRTWGRRSPQSPTTSRTCNGSSQRKPRTASVTARSLPTSSRV